MKFIIFILPLFILLIVGYMIPILKVEVSPLPVGTILTYDRTGGPANFNDHVSIQSNGEVYKQGVYVGMLSPDTLQDLTSFLESNRYSSMVESFYDKKKKLEPTAYPAPLHETTRVRAIVGTIQIMPDSFIRNLLSPYISSTP